MVCPVAACGPIRGASLTEAPRNEGCPDRNRCTAYAVVPGAKTVPQCNQGRCEFGRPDYPFNVVVDVPTSSVFAPGRSFVLSRADLSGDPGTPIRGSCVAPACVTLPPLVRGEGKYLVSARAARAVGFPLPDGTSLPLRVSFIPLVEGTLNEAEAFGLPVEPLLTVSRFVRKELAKPAEVSYVDALSVGSYLRVAYPEPPFDAYFPPAMTGIGISDTFVDNFLLGDVKTPLDDETGESRRAALSRAEGLDGWRVWLVDSLTQRRISSIHQLAGKSESVTLHTVGWSQSTSPSLKEDVEVVVAPPEDWIAVPRLQSKLINGQGLEKLDIPRLPKPASASGMVVDGLRVGLASPGAGVPSRLLFSSIGLRTLEGARTPLLAYSTSVSTDSVGRFATVLPPGLYDVVVEPSEGTGFAKARATFDTALGLVKTYPLPRRTVVTGRVSLGDGRSLIRTDVLALPSARPAAVTPLGSQRPLGPRPAKTRTDDDGRFRFEVDQGDYELVVQPEGGLGFPWLLRPFTFAEGAADVGLLEIGPPARLAFRLVDPSDLGNPIVHSMVRVFAQLDDKVVPSFEVGRAMTDAAGEVEVLVPYQPR